MSPPALSSPGRPWRGGSGRRSPAPCSADVSTEESAGRVKWSRNQPPSRPAVAVAQLSNSAPAPPTCSTTPAAWTALPAMRVLLPDLQRIAEAAGCDPDKLTDAALALYPRQRRLEPHRRPLSGVTHPQRPAVERGAVVGLAQDHGVGFASRGRLPPLPRRRLTGRFTVGEAPPPGSLNGGRCHAGEATPHLGGLGPGRARREGSAHPGGLDPGNVKMRGGGDPGRSSRYASHADERRGPVDRERDPHIRTRMTCLPSTKDAEYDLLTPA
jgi:hypothetical protein